jgi:RES domain-containing protein
MIVHRICNTAYSDDLSGTGAKLFGGRWNSKGFAMLYVAENISLAVLEMLVHSQFKDFAIELSILRISIPDAIEVKEIKLSKLKQDWIDDYSYTKFIGNEFVKSANNLLLKVPSAIVNEEHNFLINPLHTDFKKVKITEVKQFRTDKRLFTI